MTCLNVRSQNVEKPRFDSSHIRCDTTSQVSSLVSHWHSQQGKECGLERCLMAPGGEVTGGFGSGSKSEGSRAGILCKGTAKVWGQEGKT